MASEGDESKAIRNAVAKKSKADPDSEDGKRERGRESDIEPVFLVADGLNADGSLAANYRRGLRYAIDYFGNYGP